VRGYERGGQICEEMWHDEKEGHEEQKMETSCDLDDYFVVYFLANLDNIDLQKDRIQSLDMRTALKS
jgi:hypothetical protein